MKNEKIYREVFTNNTIRLVAEGGFEKATTRAIAGERREINHIKLNEAHIYRVFGTKENLFAETFSVLDNELASVIRDGFSDLDVQKGIKEQLQRFFSKLWCFLLQNEEKCRYYTRYYYSVYFKNDIYKAHITKYERLVERLTPAFVTGADVWSLLHHVITVLLDFAIRVYSGAIEDTEENAAHIFNVAYSSIARI